MAGRRLATLVDMTDAALEIHSPVGVRRMTFGELQALAEGGLVPMRALLSRESGVTHASFESQDGDYRASIPLDVVVDLGIVEVQEGGGLRLRVIDGDTLCWNVKDLGKIRLTDGPEPDSVPESPPH